MQYAVREIAPSNQYPFLLMKRLVVVESPTKARTIRNYLPPDFEVEASMGHIRDLPASASEITAELRDKPWSTIGVNITYGFEPIYEVPSSKQKADKLVHT